MDYPLVTVDWLAANIDKPSVKLVDGSWNMPDQPSARMIYDAEHIPDAVFFDIDAISDLDNPLPHMAPTVEHFARYIGAMGISASDKVIVYDQIGLFSAARVWWTFRLFGHDDVWVLHGGLPAWRSEGQRLQGSDPKLTPCRYEVQGQMDIIASTDEVRAAIYVENTTILDARPAERFAGNAPEPRAGLRLGAIPSSVNVPHSVLIEDGFLKSRDDLALIWEGAGLAEGGKVIATCGSGVTAAVIFLALSYSGWSQVKVYDGSWVEWGKEDNDLSLFPIV